MASFESPSRPHGETAVEACREFFRQAGLPTPPCVEGWGEGFVQSGRAVFGTREVSSLGGEPVPAFLAELEEVPPPGDYFLTGYGGYGFNNRHLFYYLRKAPVQALFELPFDRAFEAPERCRARIRAVFRLLERVLARQAELAGQGRWPAGWEIVLASSEPILAELAWVETSPAKRIVHWEPRERRLGDALALLEKMTETTAAR